MFLQSATVSADTTSKDKDQEEIILVKETGTRSGTITQVNAHIKGNTLTVEADNYDGEVFVLIS